MSQPHVSIITPTYNHERFIAQCVRSALSQSHDAWEMIVVDDGSTDRTAEIVAGLRDPRVRYHRKEHQGIYALAQAYNQALELARGKIIAILEGDDFWPSNKLATLLPAFEDQSVVLAYGIAQIVRTDGTPTTETIPSRAALRNLSRAVLTNDPVGSAIRPMLIPFPGVFTYPCTLLIRRSALEAMGGFQSVADGHAVDRATCINLALRGRFAFTPEIMGFWRRHASAVNSSLQLEQFLLEDCRYLRTFALAHRSDRRLSDEEFNGVERAWDRFWSRFWQGQGRQFLLRRQWGDAAQKFRQAFTGPDTIPGKMVSLLGMAASIAHADIEWVWRMRGRSPDVWPEDSIAPSPRLD